MMDETIPKIGPDLRVPAAPLPTTFDGMLNVLRARDEELVTDIDPEQLVGDIRDKVDALAYVDDQLKRIEAAYREEADEAAKKARAAKRNRKRLREYVANAMRGGDQPDARIERVPGEKFHVRLQDNAEPTLEVLREPTDFEREFLPELVAVIPERVVWNEEALTKHLASPRNADLFKEAAKLKRGTHVRFYKNPPALKLAAKPQRKRKTLP